jgi:hypothetical protein
MKAVHYINIILFFIVLIFLYIFFRNKKPVSIKILEKKINGEKEKIKELKSKYKKLEEDKKNVEDFKDTNRSDDISAISKLLKRSRTKRQGNKRNKSRTDKRRDNKNTK